jgi:hypothetical protein
LASEVAQPERHEYLDGEVFAMAAANSLFYPDVLEVRNASDCPDGAKLIFNAAAWRRFCLINANVRGRSQRHKIEPNLWKMSRISLSSI